MHEKFPEFYVDVDKLWADAVFVFDANVILDIVRMPKDEREDFLKVLKALKTKNKIWIPYQAAWEYHKHRDKELLGSKFQLQEVEAIVVANIDEIFSDIQKKYIHGLVDINLERIKTELDKSKESVKEIIDKAENSKTDYDALKNEIDSVFSNVGDDYSDDEKLKKNAEAKKRIENQIPPGYKDCGKNNGNETGDIILWFEIMDYAKENECDVIFVTNDTKEDWFLKKGKQVISPRPELLKEFHDKTKKLVYIYSESNFIEIYNNRKSEKEKLPKENVERLLKFINTQPTHQRELANWSRQRKSEIFWGKRKPVVAYHEHIDEMKEWFLENYEDPANSCPYESKEGGYVYIYGGPYEAEDVLYSEFGGIYNDREIEIAAKELEDENGVIEWSGIPSDDFQS